MLRYQFIPHDCLFPMKFPFSHSRACQKIQITSKISSEPQFSCNSHYPYFAWPCPGLCIYLYIPQNPPLSPPTHGKFSINCYSFNFMHESCLKGKMLVDQPPSCHFSTTSTLFTCYPPCITPLENKPEKPP